MKRTDSYLSSSASRRLLVGFSSTSRRLLVGFRSISSIFVRPRRTSWSFLVNGAVAVDVTLWDPEKAEKEKERNLAMSSQNFGDEYAFGYVQAQKSHSLPTENKRAREREWESSQAETK